MKTQTSSCPFNPSHKFAPEKFVFHINRCKDRQKVGHKFSKCRYNGMHFILKEDLESHQCQCPDSSELISLTNKLRNTYEKTKIIRQGRERSRERQVKKEEEYAESERQVGVKTEEHEQKDHILEECQQCQAILVKYRLKIKNGINPRLSKLLFKYDRLE